MTSQAGKPLQQRARRRRRGIQEVVVKRTKTSLGYAYRIYLDGAYAGDRIDAGFSPRGREASAGEPREGRVAKASLPDQRAGSRLRWVLGTGKSVESPEVETFLRACARSGSASSEGR